MSLKKIFAICGSTRKDSVNLHIIQEIIKKYKEQFEWVLFDQLDQLPHFNPDLDNENLPGSIAVFRRNIEEADGVLICTPEYVYSLPGSLKNAVEWTISTIVFSNKPVALITASSSGVKAFEALELLMGTIGAKINPGCSLLIQAPKTKLDTSGKIIDQNTVADIDHLVAAFTLCMAEKSVQLV